MLSASAIGFYGVQAQNDLSTWTEHSPPQSIFMSQLCQAWEAAAQSASQYGVCVMSLRFGLVLGHQGALPMMLLPIQLGIGGRLGNGQQCISWIHIHDLMRAIAHLWQHSDKLEAERLASNPNANIDELAGAYNFTAPEIVSQFAFSKIAAKQLHRPSWLATPAAPLRFALGEQSDLLLQGQRVAPSRLQALGFQFRFPDITSAIADLCV